MAELSSCFSRCADIEVKEQACQGTDTVDAGPRRQHLPDEEHSLKAAWYDDVFLLYCTFVYLADVTTDILVSVKYFHNEDYIWFSLTLFCIIGASIVMNVFSLMWFNDDTDEAVSKTKTTILHIFQLGPLQRYLDAYKNVRKTRKKGNSSEYYDMFIEQWRDITMLRLFEAFIESAPQLVLQLYILAYNREFDKEKDWLTALSACISLLSLSTSIVSYSKALRDASASKAKMTWWAFGCQLVWRLSMVASRIITLVLFASVYKSWILLVIGLHWIAMVIWVCLQGTSFCSGKKHLERLFALVIGFVYIFCFFNTKDGITRKRLVAFYIVMFIEDCLLMGMWLPYRHEYGVVFVIAVAWVFGGFLLGALAMLLYYQFYHPSLPTQGIFWHTNHEVPSVEEIVYRYLCCGSCCHIRYHRDDLSGESISASAVFVDIPVSRGSVGRSVSMNRGASPPFENEMFPHHPSELQRRHTLEKHRRKQLRAEKAQRQHQEENGGHNGKRFGQREEVELENRHVNGVGVSYEEENRNDDDAIDICGNGSCAAPSGRGPGFEGELSCRTDEKKGTGTSELKSGACGDGLHCGTDDDEETGTSLVNNGLHCRTDNEQETGASLMKKACDDGLHCGTDDEEETGTSQLKSGTCGDELHCGTDDEEETGASLMKGSCNDGLHCGTDDEQETGTSREKRNTCDDGVHCGTDDEQETGTGREKKNICDDGLHCGTDDEQETVTGREKRNTCDDGLHCGTDDEQETGTGREKRNTCDDGLHCGTDDEQETGTSVEKKTGTGVGKTKACAMQTDLEKEPGTRLTATKTSETDEEQTNKGESLNHINSLLPSRYSCSLGFNHRYSIVSDCISLSSSSSSDTTGDEDSHRDEGTTSCSNACENDTNNNPRTSSPRSLSPGGSSPWRQTSPRRNRRGNRVSFPNFVASSLNRGRFSSLRVSREDVVQEEETNVAVVDTGGPSSENKYWRFLQRLKPRKFGSVREKVQELEKCSVELRTAETDLPNNCVQMRDTKGNGGGKRWERVWKGGSLGW